MSHEEIEDQIASHEAEMVKMAEEHFELMKLVDKVKILSALGNALEDLDKTVDDLVEINYEARVSAFKMGRGKS
jgi:hypothetical protein